jgi:hypothetical protein
MNNLTTFNTPEEIWINLNRRCVEKFGNNDDIKSDVNISDITWACATLPAYLSWSSMVDYNNDIKRWIAKINDFDSKNFDESELRASPSPSSSSETESQPPSPSVGTESRLSSLSVETVSSIPPASTSKTTSKASSALGKMTTQSPAASETASSRPLAASETASSRPPAASKTASSRPPVSSKTASSRPPVSSKTASSRPPVASKAASSRPPAASKTTSSRPPASSATTLSRPPVASTTSSRPPASSTTTSSQPSASSTSTSSQLPASSTTTSSQPSASSTTTSSQPSASSTTTSSQLPASTTTSSQPSAFSTTTSSQPSAFSTTTSSQPPAASVEVASQVLAAPEKAAIQKKRKFINDSSDEEEEESDEEEQQVLSSAQLLLFKKGKRLREILLDPQTNDEILTNPEHLNLKLADFITELSAMPIKVTDVKTAENRILQWKNQGLQYENFSITAESYNLQHLMSLVQIYEDVIKVGKELQENDPTNVKNVKSWVIMFMRNKLQINGKAEQRNRLGCNRLRKLFKEGITCEQLAKSGLRKCDFFSKQENYEIFLSQLPSMDMRHSISSSSSNSSHERLSDVLDIAQSKQPQLMYDKIFNDNAPAASSSQRNKKKVLFKLDLRETFEGNVADEYKNDEYIIS